MQTRSLDSARFMSVPAPTLMFTGLSSRPRRLRQHRAPDGDAATGEHEGYRGAHVSVGRIRTEPAANATRAVSCLEGPRLARDIWGRGAEAACGHVSGRLRLSEWTAGREGGP